KNRGASGNSYSAPRETPSNDSLTLAVNEAVIADIPANQNPGGLRVNSVKTDRNSRIARLSLNENFTYLPVTQDLIRHISNSASKALPDSIRDYTVSLNVGNRNLAYYISKIDKLPEAHRTNTPFVVAASPLCNPKDGMEGDIVALWHSHGRYFRPGSGAWSWQRGFLFQSLEDTFTMSFILPYVVPMLENAGAYVMLPRERCLNRNEVIVDNDTYEGGVIYSQPYYKEMTGIAGWTTGDGEGFIYDLPDFRDTENPFENGTYRQTTTVKGGRPSVAAWYADIPEDGEYAVYVSYKTLPNSTTDAHYTVNYSGGSREFRVNQTMGGSTWVYLGSFPFKAGYSDSEPTITLSNLSEKEAGKILTADAVKIGGGMGNIARSNKRADIYYDPSTPEVAQDSPADSTESDDGDTDESGDDESSDESNDDESPDGDEQGQEQATIQTAPTVRKGPAPVFRTSGLPRYLEGARYWLQWAGIPESIYSPYHGSDDYKDDYTDRGMWVNYLAGGSRVLPDREGLNIPVDVSVALHSDAGKRSDDSYVGTLGIYYTNGGASYVDGTPRMNSRMLTDLIMRQITGDIRQTYEPNWTRRSMWDKSYLEARVAEVPTALIELLSHQNFGDMKYGLDPNFKFTVGRAIYKAIGRFISERKDRKFVVQPLPVKDFAIRRQKKGHYRLSWAPTPDPLESTAIPAAYIILERTGDELGFHKIGETHNSHFDFRTDDNLIHSFRIIAKNSGGLSFPSETLAMRESTNDSKPVLIINGFDRISAPAFFSEDGRAGFDSKNDFGVPYIYDASFTGFQTEYRRGAGDGFGRSASNYVGKIIPGNTFDFPYLHGLSIMASGRGFVSCSATAVEAGDVKLDNYKIIDYILGKQKMTVIGNGKSGVRFPTFSPKMQNLLTQFTDNGGRLLVSGAYVVSDLFDPRAGEEGQIFAEDILGISPASDAQRPESGKLTTVGGAGGSSIPMMNFEYSKDINEKRYHVENPDVLTPSEGTDAVVMMTFSDTGGAAGILTKRDKTRGVVLSIPLESIPNEETRNSLFSSLLEYLEK
ncbi:MAG: hypothetical protein K2N03_00260, partial [Muribaculaceae bacterium]|nr:hypothetical protein [Muribaculaceae bacterium]